MPDQKRHKGVTLAKEKKIYPEFVVVSENKTKTILINEFGEILHTWSLDASKLWGGDKRRYSFRKTIVFPDGDLIALVEGSEGGLYGKGLLRLDKDSNIVWKYDGGVHHSVYFTFLHH